MVLEELEKGLGTRCSSIDRAYQDASSRLHTIRAQIGKIELTTAQVTDALNEVPTAQKPMTVDEEEIAGITKKIQQKKLELEQYEDKAADIRAWQVPQDNEEDSKELLALLEQIHDVEAELLELSLKRQQKRGIASGDDSLDDIRQHITILEGQREELQSQEQKWAEKAESLFHAARQVQDRLDTLSDYRKRAIQDLGTQTGKLGDVFEHDKVKSLLGAQVTMTLMKMLIEWEYTSALSAYQTIQTNLEESQVMGPSSSTILSSSTNPTPALASSAVLPSEGILLGFAGSQNTAMAGNNTFKRNNVPAANSIALPSSLKGSFADILQQKNNLEHQLQSLRKDMEEQAAIYRIMIGDMEAKWKDRSDAKDEEEQYLRERVAELESALDIKEKQSKYLGGEKSPVAHGSKQQSKVLANLIEQMRLLEDKLDRSQQLNRQLSRKLKYQDQNEENQELPSQSMTTSESAVDGQDTKVENSLEHQVAMLKNEVMDLEESLINKKKHHQAEVQALQDEHEQQKTSILEDRKREEEELLSVIHALENRTSKAEREVAEFKARETRHQEMCNCSCSSNRPAHGLKLANDEDESPEISLRERSLLVRMKELTKELEVLKGIRQPQPSNTLSSRSHLASQQNRAQASLEKASSKLSEMNDEKQSLQLEIDRLRVAIGKMGRLKEAHALVTSQKKEGRDSSLDEWLMLTDSERSRTTDALQMLYELETKVQVLRGEDSKLRQSKKQIGQEISACQLRLTEMKRKRDELTMELSQLEKKYSDDEEKSKLLSQKMKDQVSALRTAEDEANEWSRQLALHKSRWDEQTKQAEGARLQLERLAAQKKREEAEYETITRELENFRAERIAQAQELTALQERIAKKTIEFNGLSSDYVQEKTKIETRIAAYEADEVRQRQAAEKAHEALKSVQDQLRKQSEASTGIAQEVQHVVDRNNEKLKEIQLEIIKGRSSSAENVLEATQELHRYTESLEMINKELSEKQHSLNIINREISQRKDLLQTEEAALEQIRSQRKTLQVRMEEEIETHKQLLKAFLEKEQHAKDQLNISESYADHGKVAANRLQDVISEMEKKVDQYKFTIADLRAQVTNAEKNLHSQQHPPVAGVDGAESVEDMKFGRYYKSRITKELEQLTKRKEELQKQGQSLDADIKRKRDNLIGLDEDIKSREQKVQKLQAKYDVTLGRVTDLKNIVSLEMEEATEKLIKKRKECEDTDEEVKRSRDQLRYLSSSIRRFQGKATDDVDISALAESDLSTGDDSSEFLDHEHINEKLMSQLLPRDKLALEKELESLKSALQKLAVRSKKSRHKRSNLSTQTPPWDGSTSGWSNTGSDEVGSNPSPLKQAASTIHDVDLHLQLAKAKDKVMDRRLREERLYSEKLQQEHRGQVLDNRTRPRGGGARRALSSMVSSVRQAGNLLSSEADAATHFDRRSASASHSNDSSLTTPASSKHSRVHPAASWQSSFSVYSSDVSMQSSLISNSEERLALRTRLEDLEQKLKDQSQEYIETIIELESEKKRIAEELTESKCRLRELEVQVITFVESSSELKDKVKELETAKENERAAAQQELAALREASNAEREQRERLYAATEMERKMADQLERARKDSNLKELVAAQAKVQQFLVEKQHREQEISKLSTEIDNLKELLQQEKNRSAECLAAAENRTREEDNLKTEIKILKLSLQPHTQQPIYNNLSQLQQQLQLQLQQQSENNHQHQVQQLQQSIGKLFINFSFL